MPNSEKTEIEQLRDHVTELEARLDALSAILHMTVILADVDITCLRQDLATNLIGLAKSPDHRRSSPYISEFAHVLTRNART